jgi:hypothetical protein
MAIAPYIKKAREAWPVGKKKYLAGLPQNQIFYVTINLYDPSKIYEQVFVRITSWKGESVEEFLRAIYRSFTITQRVKSSLVASPRFWIGPFPSPTVPKKATSSVSSSITISPDASTAQCGTRLSGK